MTPKASPNGDHPHYKHEWIALDQLQPHPEIQRAFVQSHAASIAAKFDPESFGELYVVKADSGGGYLIWDGQHRAWAARKALGEDQQVYCRVYEGEDAKTLAGRSLRLNAQLSWMPIDRYKLRVRSGEWRAQTIHGILHRKGLKAGNSQDDGVVAAVAALDWIMDKAGGPPTLTRVIDILFAAWGDDRNAYHGSLIRGLALVCNRYGDKLDDADMVERLVKSGGPARMVGRGRDRAKFDGRTVPYSMGEVIVSEYNKKKGEKHRLDPWGEPRKATVRATSDTAEDE